MTRSETPLTTRMSCSMTSTVSPTPPASARCDPGAPRLARVHPGGGLVSSRIARVGRQRPRHLQPSAVRVRQRRTPAAPAGSRRAASRRTRGPAAPAPGSAAPRASHSPLPQHRAEHARPGAAVLAHHRVLQNGHVREQLHVLERTWDPYLRDLIGRADPRCSSPRKAMSPSSGEYRPVMTLNTVLLPAPFGPMMLSDFALFDSEVETIERGRVHRTASDPFDVEEVSSRALARWGTSRRRRPRRREVARPLVLGRAPPPGVPGTAGRSG